MSNTELGVELTGPIELESCPFCNGTAEIERYGDARQSTIYVCTDCGCRLETGETSNHGRKWNERNGSAAYRQLQAERDEADRLAGAAERGLEAAVDRARKHDHWLRERKIELGYSTNTSFDKVWEETLAKARLWEAHFAEHGDAENT